MKKHIYTKAGNSIIHPARHSFVFEHNAADALTELNQVILHLDRLLEYCTNLTEKDIEGLYDLNLFDTMCRFQELRDGEFGDFVNWNTIAKAIRSVES